jgi:membrane-associated phospholipid phosphatase
MLAIAFSWLGKWAAPLVVLNVLMFFSAMLVGAHYAIDLVGGGVLGVASIAASLWLHRRLDTSALNGRAPAR